MLNKSQTINLIQQSLIRYNSLVVQQVTSKISTHNDVVVSTSSNGHMSSSDKVKLDGIEIGAQVNQNAIAKIMMGENGVEASATQSTVTFKAGDNITYTVDTETHDITISANNTTYVDVSGSESGLVPKITNTDGFLKGDGTWTVVDKAYIGLENVVNESKETMFNNPTFTGTVTVPALTDESVNTQAANKKYVDDGDSTVLTSAKAYSDTQLSTAKTYADQKITDLVNGAPDTLDTLKELADALGEDANLSSTLSNAIAAKADKIALQTEASNRESADSDLNNRISTLETSVGDETSGLIKDVTDLQTLIGSTSTTDLNNKIITNENNITALQGAVGNYSSTNTIEDAISAAESSAISSASSDATSKVNALSEGQVTTNKNDITAINTLLEGFSDTNKVKNYIDTQVATTETVTDQEITDMITGIKESLSLA